MHIGLLGAKLTFCRAPPSNVNRSIRVQHLPALPKGLTTTRPCSIETLTIFSDFCHFQAGSVDFKVVVVERCVSGALFKVMLVIRRGSKEINLFFTFSKLNAEKCNVML